MNEVKDAKNNDKLTVNDCIFDKEQLEQNIFNLLTEFHEKYDKKVVATSVDLTLIKRADGSVFLGRTRVNVEFM